MRAHNTNELSVGLYSEPLTFPSRTAHPSAVAVAVALVTVGTIVTVPVAIAIAGRPSSVRTGLGLIVKA